MSAQHRPERVAGLIRDYWPHRMSMQAAEAIERLYAGETIDSTHLSRQRVWSEATFGPGPRTLGITAHIRKELREIEADPADLTEWIDVVILALDGAWRTGATPDEIIAALKAKQSRNEGRMWPDWREYDQDEAIEHVAEGVEQ